ncbi:MAG: 16S rRNA (uracil(1498)-N(3))-methyltransferase [Pseudomonadota bacterium]
MSHIARIFVNHPIEAGAAISLDEGQSRYLMKVMRLSDGALVRAFNGADGEWRCTLSTHGKKALITPEVQTRPQDAGPDLTLLFAPIRRTRTELIIEKATELGVKTIQPVITEYTQFNRLRVDRLELLAIEAAEQTERLDLPTIKEPIPFQKALSEWPSSNPLIFCDEAGAAAPLSAHVDQLSGQTCGIFIGPEGGFSSKEREQLRAMACIVPITLGPRILRAETAVVSALTLWQSLVGDWQKAPYLPET